MDQPPRGGEIALIPDLVTGNVVLLLPPGLAVPPSLALATAADGRRLLAEPEDRSILAGLQIAAALGDAALAPWLARHLAGPDPVIAAAARRALAGIAGRSLAALDPDPGAALFSAPGWRAEKLQLLRHLAVGEAEATGPLLPLLARALADPDWEIAVTALLTVGRLGAGDLAPGVARARLPSGKRDGVTAEEARFILALRDGVLAHLGWPRGPCCHRGLQRRCGGRRAACPRPSPFCSVR
jgi:hypothetical protein